MLGECGCGWWRRDSKGAAKREGVGGCWWFGDGKRLEIVGGAYEGRYFKIVGRVGDWRSFVDVDNIDNGRWKP